MTTLSTMTAGTYAEGVRNATVPTPTRALSIKLDYLRTDVALLAADVQEEHDQMRGQELNERTFEKAKKDVASLLTELAYDRGMSWSNIAEQAHVSVSAVRKWRAGGAASPEKRSALARLAAMLDLLEQNSAVGDPAGWMEMELPFDEPGYYIRPLDLYLDGHAVALLDIAGLRRNVTDVLDELAPGWRQQRSDFDVYTDTDGQRSIRPRSD